MSSGIFGPPHPGVTTPGSESPDLGPGTPKMVKIGGFDPKNRVFGPPGGIPRENGVLGPKNGQKSGFLTPPGGGTPKCACAQKRGRLSETASDFMLFRPPSRGLSQMLPKNTLFRRRADPPGTPKMAIFRGFSGKSPIFPGGDPPSNPTVFGSRRRQKPRNRGSGPPDPHPPHPPPSGIRGWWFCGFRGSDNFGDLA